MKHITKRVFLIGSIVVLVLFAGVATYAGIYFYRQYQKADYALKNPTEAAKKEVEDIKKKVSTLMLTPAEEPTVATISEVEKLQAQPFFTNAQNGDKVLMYKSAKKAILYRPSAHIIVEVAPLEISDTANQTDQASKVSITLRNGTEKAGATKAVEDELAVKIKNFTIVGRDTAKSRDYKETTIVDLSGNKKQIVDALATAIGGRVAALPFGEDAPSASDILIIIGADRK